MRSEMRRVLEMNRINVILIVIVKEDVFRNRHHRLHALCADQDLPEFAYQGNNIFTTLLHSVALLITWYGHIETCWPQSQEPDACLINSLCLLKF